MVHRQPTLAGNEVDLLDLAEQIALEVAADPQPGAILNLASGLSGHALFFAHLSRVRDPEGKYSALAARAVERIIEELPRQAFAIAGLHTGVAGITWTVQHVARLLGIESLQDTRAYLDIYEFFDSYLSRDVEFEYDLIDGLTGIGLFALAIPDAYWRHRLVDRVLAALMNAALRTDQGLTWRTPTARYDRVGGVTHPVEHNLGLAHGVPGVIGFLAHCVQKKVQPALCHGALAGAVTWLRNQQLSAESASAFGYIAEERIPARLAWCYGDAGIAVALSRAADALDSDEVRLVARCVVRRMAGRQVSDAGVVDSAICHGSAGLVRTYALLARYEESTHVATAERYWMTQLLGMRRDGAGICGFTSWDASAQAFEADRALLTGASGIGLVLLSAATPGRNAPWSYPLLCD